MSSDNTSLDATDGATFDQYSLILHNTRGGGANGTEIGLCFNHYDSAYPTSSRTPGAAITHERTTSWSKGKLHFKTKQGATESSDCVTAMTINEDGNVGIGTDSPLRKLDVRSGDAVVATNWISGAFGPELSAGDRVVIGNLYGKACIGAHNSGLTGWADLTINSAGGNVGIGTVSPSYALHVQSSTNPQMLIGNSGGGGNIYFGNGNHGVGRGTGKNYFTGVNDVALYTAGGDCGLSTAYGAYYLKLTNGGVVLHNGSTVHSSDDRIKINEERITNATETLMKLDPQIYDKTIDINSSNVFGREAGLIIQDVWYDAPELRYLVLPADDANPSEEKPQRSDNIQEDPDYSDWGSKSGHFNYTGLIPYLIKSNQEQQALIENLKARIESLENSS
jgi:hypothetical protein